MSGRKNTLLKFDNIENGDMSGSIISTVTNIQHLDNVGIQLVWTGSNPLGTITFQVSADYEQDTEGNVLNAGNWATLQQPPGTDVTVLPGGTPGTTYIDILQISAPWIRVVYTTAGGSVGTLNSTITAKML